MLDIDGRAQPAHVLGNIIAEDDAPHGGFARAALAHQQHLALLLAFDRIHLVRLGSKRRGRGRWSGWRGKRRSNEETCVKSRASAPTRDVIRGLCMVLYDLMTYRKQLRG